VKHSDEKLQTLIEAVTAIVGPKGILTGEDVHSRSAYAFGYMPVKGKLLVRPETTEECSSLLKLCHARKQTIVTQAGRTGLAGGQYSDDEDIILSLERMNQVLEVDAINRTMTVEAGVILQTVQEQAVAENLFFPLDLGARGSCTIGGNIATNAGGNAVIRYGMMRDMVLGLEVVLADGTIVSSMNTLIKNNTGIDLKQLFIGSEGILGVVTKAVLRLRPPMPNKNTALLAVDSFEKLPTLLSRMDSQLGGSLSAFEVMWDSYYHTIVDNKPVTSPPLAKGYPFYVLVEAQGSNPDKDSETFNQTIESSFEADLICDGALASSEQQRIAIWDIRDDVETCIKAIGPIAGFDISLKLDLTENYLTQLNELLTNTLGPRFVVVFGHLGDGNLHINVPVKSLEEKDAVAIIVYELLKTYQGSISAEHGVGLVKRDFLHCSRNPAEIALMQQLKSCLDPNYLLNPGKIIPLS